MGRLFRAGLILGSLVAAGWLVWAYVLAPPARPPAVDVPDLSAEASIRWGADGRAHVVAASSGDALAAIGFAHGLERGWLASLWRRTAEGRLAEWFGADLRSLDRHARRLGFARHARDAFERLPEADRQRLRAYTRGLNAALQTRRVQHDAPFVGLGVSPDRWEPWHPLVVERLWAWLSTAPPPRPDTLREAAPDLRAFAEADRRLRDWLHIHGLHRSVAWTAAPNAPAPDGLASDGSAPDGSSPDGSAPDGSALDASALTGWAGSADSTRSTVAVRLVTGASALPVLHEVVVDREDAPRLWAVTIPGTLLFPAGTASGRAWGLLPGSDARFVRAAVDTARIRRRSERLQTAAGDESLVSVPRVSLPPNPEAENAERENSEAENAEVENAEGLPFRVPDAVLRADAQRRDSLERLFRRTDSLATDSLLRTRLSRDSLFALARRTDALREALDRAASGVDTTWVLRWPGFRPVTDLGAGLRLAGWTDAAADTLAADGAAFRLFDGAGLVVEASGRARVLGTPPVVDRGPRRLWVGRTRWSRFQAARLDSLLALASPAPATWTASDSSVWASTTLRTVLPSLRAMDPAPGTPGAAPLRDALAYVRNWNAVYDRASIGASIFDAWMGAYRQRIGTLPTASDTTYFADVLRRRAFRQAVDSLLARQGADLRQWRWERVAPDRRRFPVWSADSLVDADLSDLASTRYAPVVRPGRGHASTLSGGPALVDGAPAAPATWTGWTNPARTTWTARRLRFDPARFLSRPLMEGTRPPPTRLDVPGDAPTTTLRPAG